MRPTVCCQIAMATPARLLASRALLAWPVMRSSACGGAQPLSRVRATEPQTARVIDAWLARSGADERRLLYLPVRAREAWLAALIDRASAQPVKLLVTEKL